MLEALAECVIKGHYVSLLVVSTVVVYKGIIKIILTMGERRRPLAIASCLSAGGWFNCLGCLLHKMHHKAAEGKVRQQPSALMNSNTGEEKLNVLSLLPPVTRSWQASAWNKWKPLHS